MSAERAFASTERRWLEGAVWMLEWRRFRRTLAAGKVPFVYSLGVLLLGGAGLPFLLVTAGLLGDRAALWLYPGWAAGTLLAGACTGSMFAGYVRAAQLWRTEHRSSSFELWALTSMRAGPTALTLLWGSTTFAAGCTTFPILAALCAGLLGGAWLPGLALSIPMWLLCGLAGSAAGSLVYLTAERLASAWPLRIGAGLLLSAVLAAWIVAVRQSEGGWSANWEEQPPRFIRAALLITPIPVGFGLAAPDWSRAALAGEAPGYNNPLQAFGLYSLLLLAAFAWCGTAVTRAYVLLSRHPELLETAPRQEREDRGQEDYWRGFRNPVWTREVRTRLRSRGAARSILISSLLLAAGAMAPLLLSADRLSDPLATAETARQVFFWLTITLLGLTAALAPGLTADSISEERASGELDMLLTTPLRPSQILIGKLLGAVSLLVLLISPSLPLFGLCYLFRGASGEQVLAVYALVLLTMAVSSYVGVTQSAINHRTSAAKFFAYGGTAAFVCFPIYLARAVASPSAMVRQELSTSAGAGVLVMIVVVFLLVLFWGNACEQLDTSEY